MQPQRAGRPPHDALRSQWKTSAASWVGSARLLEESALATRILAFLRVPSAAKLYFFVSTRRHYFHTSRSPWNLEGTPCLSRAIANAFSTCSPASRRRRRRRRSFLCALRPQPCLPPASTCSDGLARLVRHLVCSKLEARAQSWRKFLNLARPTPCHIESTADTSPVCSNRNPPKYCCPRDSVRTCSLPCYKRHQQWAQCSGKRDPAAFVKRSDLATPRGIDHDYNFLTGIERGLQRADEDAEARSKDNKKSAQAQAKLQRYLQTNRIIVDRAPVGMSRQKTNKTRVTK